MLFPAKKKKPFKKRYRAPLPQFYLESLFWLAVLGFAVFALVSDISANLSQSEDAGIETAISLRSAEDVPFPMVVVNGGGSIDPLGFVRGTSNMAVEQDLEPGGLFLI